MNGLIATKVWIYTTWLIWFKNWGQSCKTTKSCYGIAKHSCVSPIQWLAPKFS